MKQDDDAAVPDDYDTPEKRVAAWNEYRKQNPDLIVSLPRADLAYVELPMINLSGADLSGADLSAADLSRADLSRANLVDADLTSAKLTKANLHRASLIVADLTVVDLTGANLTGANLNSANLTFADLAKAKLAKANLVGADLSGAILSGANLAKAGCNGTAFANLDLASLPSLAKVRHYAPSPISTSTFGFSKGRIPEEFLRGCGLTPWQVLSVRLYDPTLSPADIADIQQKVFNERTKGYFLSGLFISYSRADEPFVDHIYERLQAEGANVWLDNSHAIAGPLEKQVQRAIRLNDIVLLVLSESSTDSDWVEAELEWARDKEKQTGRDILCPVALDDSWKDKVTRSVLWRVLKEKNILDFSKWKTDAFDAQFRKLLDGMKVWYGPQARE
jgi:uncharacterized protein YjbI with pentapeptide repeats